MITGNEPAMPVDDIDKLCDNYVGKSLQPKLGIGLTIRQHFAAMAMQGFLTGVINVGGDNDYDTVAKAAIKYADALIAELNNQQPK